MDSHHSEQYNSPDASALTTQSQADTFSPDTEPAQFVRWFREVAPYVHRFRGKTFVIGFGGELIRDGHLNTLISDFSLLSALVIKLVLVRCSRPQTWAERRVGSLWG